jgi:hypothetical protein
MSELFQIEGKPVKGGDLLFHNAKTQSMGLRWVEVLMRVDPLRAQVRVAEGDGKGAVAVIDLANLQWQMTATQRDLAETFYELLSKGSDLERAALALIRTKDLELLKAAEGKELLSEQHNLLTRCLTHRARLPNDLADGISKADQSFRTLTKPTVAGTPIVQVFPLKGTGTWHVAQLEDRVWVDVSGTFPTKFKARMWALNNGYSLESADQKNGSPAGNSNSLQISATPSN